MNEQREISSEEKRRNYVVQPNRRLHYDEDNDIAIIKGLSFNDEIQEIAFHLAGWEKNPLENDQWEYVGQPILNKKGIRNFTNTLRAITAKVFTMGNLQRDQVINIVKKLVKHNMAYFIAFHEVFDLKEENYNVIETYLFTCSVGAATKAIGAGDRNAIIRTYSEDVMAKIYGGDREDQGTGQKKKWSVWPFRRKSG